MLSSECLTEVRVGLQMLWRGSYRAEVISSLIDNIEGIQTTSGCQLKWIPQYPLQSVCTVCVILAFTPMPFTYVVMDLPNVLVLPTECSSTS